VARPQYAYLLGLYLGDGHLTLCPRDVWRLRIVQDARYTRLIELCGDTIEAVAKRRAGYVRKIGCVEIYAYWKHWIHLFPQHGPGRKHERRILLEEWQLTLVREHPKQFLAGLIHSDGCRFINPIVARRFDGSLRRYAYPRYVFTSASDDIRALFTDTCELLGVRWTQTGARNVAVSRSRDVSFLDTFIGPKS